MSDVRTWSSNWRCIHVDVVAEDSSSNIEAGRIMVFDHGDCGNAWGEERDTRCPHHTLVYASGTADVTALVESFLDTPDCHLVVVTDPNNWSEKVAVMRFDTHALHHKDCTHWADGADHTLTSIADLRGTLSV